jgi:hypothetical protein
MTNTRVHLEDVNRAARQGVALALGASLLVLVAMIAAGLALTLAIAAAIVLLAIGALSGGFGLVALVALTAPRTRRRAKTSAAPVTPLRVAQTR